MEEEKVIFADDVIKIIDDEISLFDYKSFGILDELYKIKERINNIPDYREE